MEFKENKKKLIFLSRLAKVVSNTMFDNKYKQEVPCAWFLLLGGLCVLNSEQEEMGIKMTCSKRGGCIQESSNLKF